MKQKSTSKTAQLNSLPNNPQRFDTVVFFKQVDKVRRILKDENKELFEDQDAPECDKENPRVEVTIL
jgi:hypothetical protein